MTSSPINTSAEQVQTEEDMNNEIEDHEVTVVDEVEDKLDDDSGPSPSDYDPPEDE